MIDDMANVGIESPKSSSKYLIQSVRNSIAQEQYDQYKNKDSRGSQYSDESPFKMGNLAEQEQSMGSQDIS